MIDSDFKRLGFFIQYVGNEITLQITSEYDWHVLIPLLVHVFKFLNPSVASERTFNVTLKNIEATLLYDVMEAKKEMVLSMVKKVEYFIIKKVNEEECKDLLTWYNDHEVQFSYVGVCGKTNLEDCWVID
jgi:hypothetical protein